MSDYWSAEYKAALINELNEVRELLAECQHGNDKLREEAAAHRKRANKLVKRVQELERRAEALAEALKTLAQHPYLYGGARVAADVMEVYCKLCNAIGEGTLWNIEHADTCPVGQGLAALAEWVEVNR